MDSSGELFGGRYRLGASLGVGGTSAVYEATDVEDPAGRQVAVKVLHPHLSGRPGFSAAFLREAQRLAGLHQENIAAVRGWGVHDAGGVRLAWLALDLVPGPDLATWVEASGPMPLPQAAAVLDGILAGLTEAHRGGVVHRDLSPRNVLLDGTTARIIDFGLAAAAGGTTLGGDLLLAGDAGSGTIVGNAGYLSPEQASGRPVTESSDLYAAGAVAYFLLTGQQPYPRDDVRQVLAAHVSAPPPVPSALVPSAHPLDRVVTTAMTKDPRGRYADAATFRSALAAALQAPAQADRPATRVLPATAVRPVGQQRPATFAAALTTAVIVAVVAIVLVTGLVGGLVPVAHSPAASASPSPTPTLVDRLVVPHLHGSLSEAETSLALAGLRLGKVRRADSARPADQVLSQSPAGGKKASADSAVSVVVASGENVVPRVVGKSAGTGSALVASAGFSVSSDRAEPDPRSVIVGTEPSAGTRLQLGVTVTLLLGDAPPASASPAAEPSPGPTALPSPSPSMGG